MKVGKCWLPFSTEFFVFHSAVLACFQNRRCYAAKLRLQLTLLYLYYYYCYYCYYCYYYYYYYYCY